MNIITLFPAYGREYRSRKAILADWNSGKDFELSPSGVKINIRDLEKFRELYNTQYLHFRYNCLSRVFVLKVSP